MFTLINILHLLSFCSAMIVPRVDITGRNHDHKHSDRIFIHECPDLSRPRCTYSTEIQYCANYILLHPIKYDTLKWDSMGDCGQLLSQDQNFSYKLKPNLSINVAFFPILHPASPTNLQKLHNPNIFARANFFYFQHCYAISMFRLN